MTFSELSLEEIQQLHVEISRFQKNKKIGERQFGKVYLYKDTKMNQNFSIKFF
jgi:hypothetical protein